MSVSKAFDKMFINVLTTRGEILKESFWVALSLNYSTQQFCLPSFCAVLAHFVDRVRTQSV